MSITNYPYVLPPLSYPYNALEPYIDEETMRYHHDKHFQTYINNLNLALKDYPHLQKMSLSELLQNSGEIPLEAYTQVMNNAGGVYNHNLFFQKIAPTNNGFMVPQGKLALDINKEFGAYENFKKTFSANALSVFGSGWTALAYNREKKLEIFNLKNQETTLTCGAGEPIILFDVWEHAYYLKYKNARADYVNNLWNVVYYPLLQININF